MSQSVRLHPPTGLDRRIRIAGFAAVTGAGLAIIANAFVVTAAPDAAPDTVSYPLAPGSFQFGQVVFAFAQLLMTSGMIGLARSRIGGTGRLARVGSTLAIGGFALTVPGELLLAFVAGAANDSARANAVSTAYGVAVLVADIGLIALGIAALRARVWSPPAAWLVLGLGLFQLLVVTPVVLGSGFASGAAFFVITIQDLIVALIGVRLVRATTHYDGRPHAVDRTTAGHSQPVL